MRAKTHARHIVVWDAPAGVRPGERFSIKVGIKCEAECLPSDWTLQVLDDDGAALAMASVPTQVWPETEAMFGDTMHLTAPDVEGRYRWRIVAPDTEGSGAQVKASPGHDEAQAFLDLRVLPRADFRLTVLAIEKQTGVPIAGARVVVHPHRAVTGADGRAAVDLSAGRFRLFVSRTGFLPVRLDGDIQEDESVRVELDADEEPSDAELWA